MTTEELSARPRAGGRGSPPRALVAAIAIDGLGRRVGPSGKRDQMQALATFGRGTLLADANFSGQLRFPAPAEGVKRFIEFRDPAADEPVVIDLGRRGERTPDSAFDKFREGSAAR